LPLPLNIADQEQRFSGAFRILAEAIAEKAFPGASMAVLHRGQLLALHGFGRYTYAPDSTPVIAETIFDIASVTKVVATTTMAAVLYERGKLQLDALVADFSPEFRTDDLRRSDVSIRALLTHTSGLPAYKKLFEQTRDRQQLIHLAYATPLEADPEARTEYSDIGFIILGDILEKVAGESLDRFCQREIFARLGLSSTYFKPPAELRAQIAPTSDDKKFRHRPIQGEVHDENASVMHGVAGHAGVFSTSYDVALFAYSWLSGGSPILKPLTAIAFTRQQPGSSRALGWDRPTPPSSSGEYLSPHSFGHLGFTGTSLWCDPEKQLAIVLLTNRTWPDSSNQAIRQIRPRFHDAIVKALP
jgi:CubicO group peptidase (beta-lactamase class C family)